MTIRDTDNAAVKRSMTDGKLQQVGDSFYMGANREYKTVELPAMAGQPAHTITFLAKKGIPWVRVA